MLDIHSTVLLIAVAPVHDHVKFICQTLFSWKVSDCIAGTFRGQSNLDKILPTKTLVLFIGVHVFYSQNSLLFNPTKITILVVVSRDFGLIIPA